MSIFYERRLGVCSMCIVWALVILIAAHMLSEELDVNTVVSLVISAVFICIAIITYLGHYGFISGFSTMSLEELNRYNLESITYCTGICMFAISVLSFGIYAATSHVIQNSTALMISVIVLIVMLAIWAIWITFSPRFKN